MDLAMHRGLLAGVAWATQLLQPLSTMPRPKCPHPLWQPIKRFSWHLGFSYGCYSILHRR